MKPKKERPSALSDSIFRAKLGTSDDIGGVPEEIPVHNTFIQFDVPPDSASFKKPLSTAPAWIGPSFQNIIQQASMEAAPQQAEPKRQEEADSSFFAPIDSNMNDCLWPPEDDEDGTNEMLPLGSPQKVPTMRYALSSSSARAAGLPDWSPTVVPTPGPIGEAKVGTPPTVQDDDRAVGPPAAVSGALPSVGSALHSEGSCKRCCFFPKGRCQNGHSCEFCHFEHEKRKRKKKKKGAGARRDAAGDESETDDDDDETDPAVNFMSSNMLGGQTHPGAAAGIWQQSQPDPIGSMRHNPHGLPLTAPPALPPRGLPVPTEPPPPAPHLALQQAAGRAAAAAQVDPYYGAYDLHGPFGASANPYGLGLLGGYGGAGAYGGADARLAGLGGVGLNQSYFGGGYDPAAVAAQQQQSSYQQPAGRYLPPPR
jgi:hypothetical protein